MSSAGLYWKTRRTHGGTKYVYDRSVNVSLSIKLARVFIFSENSCHYRSVFRAEISSLLAAACCLVPWHISLLWLFGNAHSISDSTMVDNNTRKFFVYYRIRNFQSLDWISDHWISIVISLTYPTNMDSDRASQFSFSQYFLQVAVLKDTHLAERKLKTNKRSSFIISILFMQTYVVKQVCLSIFLSLNQFASFYHLVFSTLGQCRCKNLNNHEKEKRYRGARA